MSDLREGTDLGPLDDTDDRTRERARRWFLSARERGNPDTGIDGRHPDGAAYTIGCSVVAHIHGSDYFAALARELARVGTGDLVLFTDWRGDPDELLTRDGPTVSQALSGAATRGADVRGLVWRSHLDRFAFSARENRHTGDDVDRAGGQCLLDQRVRFLGSHHQKMVVVRYGDRPADDVAFVGGIDLCHGRRDDGAHRGDPQAIPMAAVYGETPAWHDVQLEIRGPAVGDVEHTFRERWDDPQPLSLNPVHLVGEIVHGEQLRGRPLPQPTSDPGRSGRLAVQVLRTYPPRRPAYPFARDGERSIARAYAKALSRATRLVYLEDQYLWSCEVAQVLADTLAREPALRMVVVVPAYPDQDGRFSLPPNLVGREPVLRMLEQAGPGRVAVLAPENHGGVPVYVHAKVSVIDDEWACVGSDNVNRRSWTHDSELSAAFVDDPDGGLAQQLRLRLMHEHLDGSVPSSDLVDPVSWFEHVTRAAAALDAWHVGGRRGERPPGRLRPYRHADVPRWSRPWAKAVYSVAFDPDGRPRGARRRGEF